MKLAVPGHAGAGQIMRRIGLIGGVTWAATADYYRRINLEIKRRLAGHHSAEMIVRSLDLHPLLLRADHVEEIAAIFATAGQELHGAGAQLLAVASFTGHRYADTLPQLGIPFIDITCCIADAVRSAGHAHIAVWATSYALGDHELITRISQTSGAQLMLPAPELREQLDAIVFNELADQNLTAASLSFLRDLLDRQIKAGAEALLLATTDFSPVAKLLDRRLPIMDATEIHCTALVDAALGK